MSAYRIAFDEPRAVVGRQPEPLAGALRWVLPNPSGLNAHYQIDRLVGAFDALREALDAEVPQVEMRSIPSTASKSASNEATAAGRSRTDAAR